MLSPERGFLTNTDLPSKLRIDRPPATSRSKFIAPGTKKYWQSLRAAPDFSRAFSAEGRKDQSRLDGDSLLSADGQSISGQMKDGLPLQPRFSCSHHQAAGAPSLRFLQGRARCCLRHEILILGGSIPDSVDRRNVHRFIATQKTGYVPYLHVSNQVSTRRFFASVF